MNLRGKTFTAEFSSKYNNFTSIKNIISNDEYIKKEVNVPIITLYGTVDNIKSELIPQEGKIQGNENELTIEYGKFSNKDIKCNLIIKAIEDKLVMKANIENLDNTVEITEILMPHISGIYLGESYEDDSIIYPHHAGEKTLNPVTGYGINKKDFWRASSVKYNDIYRREINYCGLASMSWMYYYDDNSGLYIGSHDERFPVTGIIAETSGSTENPWMGFGFRKYKKIKFNDIYDTGEYVLAITDKDWHYGSKVYRDYIGKYLDFDHNPEYLKEQFALNQCYNFKRSGRIENTFDKIPILFEKGKEFGANHMFLASWNRTGFDSFYPEYYPDMELGSAMEFRRGLEYIRDHDGMATLYINARIFDVKSDFHKTVGERMGIIDENGEFIYEIYGPEKFTVNCPSDKLWREYLLDTAEFTVKAYGCDGIYLDQLASAEPLPCYNQEHSHEDIGEFNNGYIYVLRELLKRLRKHNPKSYIMTENCGDIYGSYTWGNLTWNGADYDEFYNVFKYTFPEFVQVNMVNPRGWEENEDKQYKAFFKDMQRAIVLGNILWLGITTRLTEDAGEYHTYAKASVAFRKNIHQYIKDAEFIDNKYITRIPNECEAAVYRISDYKYAVIVGNCSNKKDSKLSLKFKEKVSNIEAYNMEWDKEVINVENDEVLLSIDKSRLYCFIINI